MPIDMLHVAPGLAKFWDDCQQQGMALRLVGGCVRDHLLGLVPHDLDLATPARPEDIMRQALQSGLKAIPTGILHGTVTVCGPDFKAEITTLRRDVQADGRHALIAFTDDWAIDAQRRDFTINALFMDRDGQIHDYTGGIDDLRAQRVRFIGAPAQRIREDYLRILRFFRFHARFGGATPDAAGLAACGTLRDGVRQLSMERVRDEIWRLLTGPRPVEMLHLMQDQGILACVDPCLGRLDRLNHLMQDTLFQDAEWRFRCLLPDDVAMLRQRGNDWRVPGRIIRDWIAVCSLNPADTKSFRRDLYRLGPVAGQRCLFLNPPRNPLEAQSIIADIIRLGDQKLPVDGRDIMNLTGQTGPAVGDFLEQLLDWWLVQEPKPDRDACLAQIRMIAKQ